MTPVETSPLGDTRKRAVPCRTCRRKTFNHSARCSVCLGEERDLMRLDAQERQNDAEDAA